jgi:hypothetical protein
MKFEGNYFKFYAKMDLETLAILNTFLSNSFSKDVTLQS